MAGSSMTFTYDRGPGPVARVIADWVSDDATGAVSGTTTAKLVGRLVRAVTDPSGTAAPDDNYDIALTDVDGMNPLAGCDDDLANRHTSTTQEIYFRLLDAAGTDTIAAHPVVCGVVTVAVTNAGNAKAGRLVLYLEGSLSGGG